MKPLKMGQEDLIDSSNLNDISDILELTMVSDMKPDPA